MIWGVLCCSVRQHETTVRHNVHLTSVLSFMWSRFSLRRQSAQMFAAVSHKGEISGAVVKEAESTMLMALSDL